MGSGGFLFTYFAAGIFGYVVSPMTGLLYSPFFRNVLGGNFSLVGIPSVGASGAIFGTVAVRGHPFGALRSSFNALPLIR